VVLHDFTRGSGGRRCAAMTALTQHLDHLKSLREDKILPLFEDGDRMKRFAVRAGSLRLDLSKQAISGTALDTLLAMAKDADLEGWRARFFGGEAINTSEDRAVLHPALRGVGGSGSVQAEVREEGARMDGFASELIESGEITGVLHIGIGGSDLGPRLIADALAAIHAPKVKLRFAENVDGDSINRAVADLDPARTLVIVVSKSFGTQETLMNGTAAREWLGGRGRMVAVTANRDRAIKFGINSDDIFDFWDWVGGRYSLWSAVGLSLRIAFGPEVIRELLAGAAEMDKHFRDAEMAQNLPVLMGLVGVWNRNVEGYGTLAVIPYATALRLLPSFLQQLEMESNGKSVTRDGELAQPACPVVWGTEGTNGQHAYFQWLHQGAPGAPVDFIAVLKDYTDRGDHHRALLANCFAQSEALMLGKSKAQVRAENPDSDTALISQKMFPGNRPSSTLTLDELTARSLGELIALYEHKVFVQGVIWGVNSFDQWGVELGKVLAGTLLGEMESGRVGAHDASTTALMGLV